MRPNSAPGNVIIGIPVEGYDADIICLQEMDRKHFSAFYKPILDRSGYESSMLMKQYRKLPKDFTAQRACAAEGIVW